VESGLRFLMGGLVVSIFASLRTLWGRKASPDFLAQRHSVVLAMISLTFVKDGAHYAATESRSYRRRALRALYILGLPVDDARQMVSAFCCNSPTLTLDRLCARALTFAVGVKVFIRSDSTEARVGLMRKVTNPLSTH